MGEPVLLPNVSRYRGRDRNGPGRDVIERRAKVMHHRLRGKTLFNFGLAGGGQVGGISHFGYSFFFRNLPEKLSRINIWGHVLSGDLKIGRVWGLA